MLDTAIVTCSSACIPEEFVEEYGIHVVPLTLVIGDRVYRDGIDITRYEFYEALKKDYSMVSTSAPSVGDYLKVFHEIDGKCGSVLCVTMASDISTSFAAAVNAAAKVDSMPVRVFDSGTAATGQASVAMGAARLAKEGADLASALECARKVSDRVKVLGAIETLDYLKQSGRVNSISAFAAGKLNIKPVFIFEHGEVRPLAKTRSKRRAFEKIARVAEKTFNETGPLHLAVFHAMAEEEAKRLESLIKESAECRESFIAEFTPVMGKHTGPGLVGASFY